MFCICQFLPSKPTHSLVFQASYKGDEPAIQSANVAHSGLPHCRHRLLFLLLIPKEICMASLVSFWAQKHCRWCQAYYQQHMQSKAIFTHCLSTIKNNHYSCDQRTESCLYCLKFFLYLMHFSINICFIFRSEAIVVLFSKNNHLMHSLLF